VAGVCYPDSGVHIMKSMIPVMLACLIVWPVLGTEAQTTAVKVGDHFDDVIALLGQPEGLMRMDASTWMQYNRGLVKLKHDLVVEANLISPEEARIRLEQELKQQMERELVLAEQRNMRMTEGQAVKLARVNDPYFMSLPAERQVAYWRQFQIQYPEVSSQLEYLDALSRFEQEQEKLMVQREQEQRIRDLEDRLARAERQNEEQTRIRYVQNRFVYVPAPFIFVPTYGRQVHCAPVRSTLSTAPFTYRNRQPGMSLAARMSFY